MRPWLIRNEPRELVTSCNAPQICRPSDGHCVEDNCNGFPERCTSAQFCVNGTCIDDPCANVSCTAPEYCSNGTCIRSCADVSCNANEICVLGQCTASPCAGVMCPMYVTKTLVLASLSAPLDGRPVIDLANGQTVAAAQIG